MAVIVRMSEESAYNPDNDSLSISNEQEKVNDGFELIHTNLWDIVTGAGDLIEAGGNSAGSSYVKISKDVLNDNTKTVLLSKFVVQAPFRAALALTLSQRLHGQRFMFEFVGVDKNGNVDANVPAISPIVASSIQQTTTVLSITTATAHGLNPGDRLVTYGASDSRLNYSELIVATVTSSTAFTCTATGSGTIPSLSAGACTGFILEIDPFDLADNAYGLAMEGLTATQEVIMSRANKSSYLPSTPITFGTTAAVVGLATPFSDSLQPSTIFDIRYKHEGIITRSFPIDSLAVGSGNNRRSQLIPDIAKNYKIRIRAINHKDMTRPVAKIVSATKSGTTTATIVTDVAHNLTTGDLVTLYGMRDQTNFANLTTATAVATVVNGTTFTIAFGGSFSGVSYGGTVIRHTSSQPANTLAQSIQSMSRTGNLLTLVGSAAWTALSVGQTVNLHGIYDTTGAAFPQYEGVYKVASVATTNLVLYSVGADYGSINVGGSVLVRTDLRLHFFRILAYSRNIVDVDGSIGNTADLQDSLPVAITNAPAVTATVAGGAAHDAAVSGSPVRLAGRALTANYTAVSTGDTADLVTTLAGALVNKPFSIPDLDFMFAAPKGGILNTATPLQVKEAAAAGIRNYLTALDLFSEALTSAAELEVREPDIACSSQTIASNILTTAAAHNLAIGDTVVPTASTVTGLTAGVTYFVLTAPSGTTLTLSATRGGSTLAISGTGVTATFHKYLYSVKIPTTGMSRFIEFPTPLRGSVNTALQIQTITASGAGAVFANGQGFTAP